MAVSDDPTRAAIELSLPSWISPSFPYQAFTSKFSCARVSEGGTDQREQRNGSKSYLGEVGRNNGAVGKLAAGQRTQRLGCDFWRLELDVDLPDAGGLPTAADRSGDL